MLIRDNSVIDVNCTLCFVTPIDLILYQFSPVYLSYVILACFTDYLEIEVWKIMYFLKKDGLRDLGFLTFKQ